VSQRSEALGNDPLGDRPPTSHEHLAGRPWDASYRDGTAPWDIGRPQPVVVRLASAGAFSGPVLDAGCGTGENALHIASLGVSVLGVDVAETALDMARDKAAERGVEAEFAWADALHLDRLGCRFGTVLDCGLFHTFGPDERRVYVRSLAPVIVAAGTVYVLCFSDEGAEIGPHPVSERDLRAAFTADRAWDVVSVHPARIETLMHEHGAAAWLATVRRADDDHSRP
jgi:SAM-dependent methyltransferase